MPAKQNVGRTGPDAATFDLQRAIERGQLLLHYQPKVRLRDHAVVGVEALCRWNHPIRGVVPPDQFIPLAEQTGLIWPLTLWVLDEALRQRRAWLEQGWPLEMAVNLSSQELYNRELVSTVATFLERHRIEPGALLLEITEGSIMAQPEVVMETVARLHGMGVRVAIDDFGTGYSSLAYLKHLSVDEVKIAREFVTAISQNERDRIIVDAVIEVGHKLGTRVVAEGVEEEDCLALLRSLDCDIAQGFYIGRPMSTEDLATWLTPSRTD